MIVRACENHRRPVRWMQEQQPGEGRGGRLVSWATAIVLAFGLLVGSVAGQPAPGPAPLPGGSATTGSPGEGQAPARRTEAERIISLRRLLQADREQLQSLREEQDGLKATFDAAVSAFEALDVRLTAAQGRQTGGEPKAGAGSEAASVGQQWTAARDRLNLVIERRKAVQGEISTLTDKIALEQQILDGMTEVEAPAAGGPAGAPAPAHPAETAKPAPTTTAAPATPPDPLQFDEEVVAARKEQAERQAALTAAQARVSRLEHGIDVFERDLVSSRRVLQTARGEAQAADAALSAANADLEQHRGAGEAEVAELAKRRDSLRDEASRLHAEAERQSGRVATSEATLNNLKRSRAEALDKLHEARAASRSARNTVLFYESPFAPHRLRWWLTVKGPRVLAVVLAMIVVWWLARGVGRRLVVGIARKGKRGTDAEREGRAETIRRAFQSGASAAIIVLGVLAALHEAGIDVTILLGGTAVVGAAIAFGSQNMVRDYFGGFMILIENQYSVGNVIRIGDITGTVEGLTLRMTSVRDLEGILHFIPHSQVTQVSNLTYGWSRIVLDVRIAAGEDVDRVMGVLMDVAHGLANDADFGPRLVGEPQMLGVDSLAGSAVILKLLVKTQPLQRWPVKRELLRRIKKTFDAQGIKIA